MLWELNVVVFSCLTSIYLGLDKKRPISTNGNLLLHDAEPVEAADEHSSTVKPECEVHIVTGEAVLVVLDVLAPVDIEEDEVMKMTSGKRLPVFIICNKQRKLQLQINFGVFKFHFTETNLNVYQKIATNFNPHQNTNFRPHTQRLTC